MSVPRILVAGVGNVFFGDDAFGVEVVHRLAARPQACGVDVVDFGIRGLDLAYALSDGYDAAILVDAVPRGRSPGTLVVLEPDVADGAARLTDTHAMEPEKILEIVRASGARLPTLRVVGCEPSPLPDDAMAMGLSAPVASAVAEAVSLVERLVDDLRAECVSRA